MNENSILQTQYKIAIDARDKNNDNYHKWTTFYYIVNAGIIVAITSLFGNQSASRLNYFLPFCGSLICVFWNLSCKGYYYWANSWIEIIIRLEKQFTKNDENLFVYAAFSQHVADQDKKGWLPTTGANLSTPKLTMLFSLCSVIFWALLSLYRFWHQENLKLRWQIGLSIAAIGFLIVFYFLLMKKLKSRKQDMHKLI